MFYMQILRVFALCVALTHVAMADQQMLVIAHRGDSGHFPEHTLEAYQSAIDKGADYIEPDLVITRDGVLVARHDIYLSTSTNVADLPEFATRKRVFQGRDDWFVFDFSYAELQKLRARQTFPGRSKELDDKLKIPTFEQVIELAKRAGRPVGIYPEMKRPDAFEAQRLDPAEKFVRRFNELVPKDMKAFVQCFYPSFLAQIRGRVDAPLVLLLYAEGSAADGDLRPNLDIQQHIQDIDGIGISKDLLLLEDDTGPGGYVRWAHNRAMFVHIWTVRDDAVPEGFTGVDSEIAAYKSMGVDGFFTDFPGSGRRVIDTLTER